MDPVQTHKLFILIFQLSMTKRKMSSTLKHFMIIQFSYLNETFIFQTKSSLSTQFTPNSLPKSSEIPLVLVLNWTSFRVHWLYYHGSSSKTFLLLYDIYAHTIFMGLRSFNFLFSLYHAFLESSFLNLSILLITVLIISCRSFITYCSTFAPNCMYLWKPGFNTNNIAGAGTSSPSRYYQGVIWN